MQPISALALALVPALVPATLPSATHRALAGGQDAAVPTGFERLTIERVYWYHSPERDADVAMRLDDPLTAGHLLMHVSEGADAAGVAAFREFWNEARKDFLLVAPDRLPVRAEATRGYWVFADRGLREFYLRLEPEELRKLEVGVRYRVIPPPKANGRAWVATEDAVVVLPARSLATEVRTLDRLIWTDDPEFGGRLDAHRDSLLLGHVAEWHGQAELKRYTQLADKRIWLRAADRDPIALNVSTGSISNESGETRYVFLRLLGGLTREDLAGVRWMVEPSKEGAQHWRVAGDARWLDLRK